MTQSVDGENGKKKDSICSRGTSVVIKVKKSQRKKEDKGNGKKKHKNNDDVNLMGRTRGDREVIIERVDGRVLHFDCRGDDW